MQKSAPQTAEPIPQLDLKPQYQTIKKDVLAAVERVLESQVCILGPQVAEFEKQVAAYLGTKNAIGVSSGSDALVVALRALGIGPGDGVLCPSFTFFATGGAVARLGATPIFLDIEDDTFNLSPSSLADYLERNAEAREVGGKQVVYDRKRNLSVKAVIPVHLFGAAGSMDRIMALCRDRGLAVVEDTAQALGASYKGRKAGTIGSAGCYSFFPSKNLGAMGDAGLVTTDNDELAAHIRKLRVHGGERRYYHNEIGFNFRIDTVQCAILLVKLPHLDSWNASRRQVAARYHKLFDSSGLAVARGGPVRLPEERPEALSIYHQYTVRVPAADRDPLAQYLTDHRVGNGVYYPVPLHMQPCFASLGYTPESLPVSSKAAGEVLALPIFPELTESQQERVVSTIGSYFSRA